MDWRSPFLGALLAATCLVTILGNVLVVVAVARKPYLQTPTGYMIVSLAAADLIVGLCVMPINALYEMSNHVWIFGDLILCDVWHSVDVLACTASIWSLCVISLDRYIANYDPIGYPDRMSPRRSLLAIVIVWTMSACLSFPAILWWRYSSPELYTDPSTCGFTTDTAYVVFSSCVSFIIPLSIILYCYVRVFRIASQHSSALRAGAIRGGGGTTLLRVHYGGRSQLHTQHSVPLASRATRRRIDRMRGGAVERERTVPERGHTTTPSSLRRSVARKSRSVIKYVREQRAAQTLSIVVGCFCICWLPFFVVNILLVTCPNCLTDPAPTFTVLTWLGHCNSLLNPLIYSRFSRDFRRAFVEVLTWKERRPTMRHGLSSAIEAPLTVAMGQVAAMYGIPQAQVHASGSTNLEVAPRTSNDSLTPIHV